MSLTCFWTIYVIGLFLIPLIWGIWQYDTIRRSWDDDNYIMAAFVIGLWPVVVFLGVGFLGVATALAGPFFLFKSLLDAGAKLRQSRVDAAYRKRHPEEFVDNTCEECDGGKKND